MTEEKPIERRKYARLTLQTKVNFRIKEKVADMTTEAMLSGMTKNISLEGISFRTDKELAAGTKLELEVFLPSESEPLLLRGEVRWSSPVESPEKGKEMFDIGIRLLTFEERDETRYLKYVNDKMVERLRRHLSL